MHRFIFTVLLLIIASTANAQDTFTGRHCVVFFDGTEDCIIFSNRKEYEQEKAKQEERIGQQSDRYHRHMMKQVEKAADDDHVLRELLDALKEAEQE